MTVLWDPSLSIKIQEFRNALCDIFQRVINFSFPVWACEEFSFSKGWRRKGTTRGINIVTRWTLVSLSTPVIHPS